MAFDLEKAVAAWRRPFEHNRAFSGEDLEELEGSLRDRVSALVASGLPEPAAFREALRRMGSYGTAETEYRKVYWGKLWRKRQFRHELSWRLSMLKNYLKIAWRNLLRKKGYAFINIVGLATGIAASVLLLLFVRHETSFDTHQENAANLYRLGIIARASDHVLKTALTAPAYARTLVAEFPEVVNAARFYHTGRVLLGDEDRRFYEERFFWADSTVFDLFTIPFVAGDPATALTRPNSVVLTEEMAHKYFDEADPIGQTLRINNSDVYTVTGVIRPIEANSHLEFDFLASLVTLPDADEDTWVGIRYHTYLLLHAGASPEDVLARMPEIDKKYVAPQLSKYLGSNYTDGLEGEYFLENVSDIYLHSDAEHQIGPTGNVQYVYIMSTIALFILLIASINFMNLTTASSTQRAKEVGVRKVMGSKRSQLIFQFLSESILMALLALLLAYVIVWVALPVFQSITGVALALSASVVLGMMGIAAGTGLIAGIYPAFVLSSFKPATVLKGRSGQSTTRSWMRSGLVVTQFAISITLLVGTAVVYNQLQFIQDKDLGFDKDHVVVLPIETRAGAEHFDSFRLKLLQNPNIIEVAASSVLPGPGHQHSRGFRKEGDAAEELYVADWGEVSPDYMETLGLEMVAGRTFSREHPADVEGFIFNEAAARMMGWDPQTALGQKVMAVNDSSRTGPVLGVFKDAHFRSLHETMQPLIFGARYASDVQYMPVRIKEGHVRETMAYLEQQWSSFEPEHVFTYFFLDEDYGRFYEQDRRLGKIYDYFTPLAILIACLGLFGLVAFVTQRRSKEIGVRKVLGASVPGLVALLSKDFLKLVGIAFIVGAPVAYFVMQRWLDSFAYRVDIPWWIFLTTGLAAMSIALATVSYQAIRAALADPVKSLRYE